MLTSVRTSLLSALLAAAAATVCAAENTDAPSSPSPATLAGTVKLKGGTVGAGLGYQWGHGTLTYRGQQFEFCIRGLSVGDVGVTSVDAQGNVYNLQERADFGGRYFSISGGFAIGRGGSGALLKNQHGVMMQLDMLEHGLRFNIAATGLKIAFAGQPGCKAR